MQYQVNPQG
jgi:hypothetical protein